MLLRGVILAAMGVLLCAPLHAQRNCRTGIPCGNSCIAATKTCRIGGAAAPRSESPSSSVAPSNVTPPALGSRAQLEAGAIPPASTHPWVALRGGTFFYRRSCRAARELPRQELVYFKSETEAVDSGRLPSEVAGCGS